MSKPLLETIATALSFAPSTCRYHGTDWDFLGREPDGSPRCDSCKHPYWAERARVAVDQLVDVVVAIATERRG